MFKTFLFTTLGLRSRKWGCFFKEEIMLEKQLLKYIVPSILAMLGTSCYVLADTFFIAAYEGAKGITALNLVLPVYGLIYGLGSLIGIGSATRYSLVKASGANDYDQYFFNAIIWTLLISLIFIITGIFFAPALLKFLGADALILKVGLNYLKIVLCFAPFFMLNYTFTAFVRNDDACNIAMMATLISGIFNIVFDYIFIFPMKMGMTGAALATALAPLVSMLVCLVHYLSSKNTVKLVITKVSLKKLLMSCNLGIVAFISEISSGITTMVFNYILLNLGGNLAVAAYGIVANFALVAVALFNGVVQGLQPLASKSHGLANKDYEKRIFQQALLIAILIALILIFIVLTFGDKLVLVFNQDNSKVLAMLANRGMKIYFLGFLFASINMIRAGFYSATGKAKESALIACLRGVVAIVFFAVVLSYFWQIDGVWLSFLVAEVFTFVLSVILIKKIN